MQCDARVSALPALLPAFCVAVGAWGLMPVRGGIGSAKVITEATSAASPALHSNALCGRGAGLLGACRRGRHLKSLCVRGALGGTQGLCGGRRRGLRRAPGRGSTGLGWAAAHKPCGPPPRAPLCILLCVRVWGLALPPGGIVPAADVPPPRGLPLFVTGTAAAPQAEVAPARRVLWGEGGPAGRARACALRMAGGAARLRAPCPRHCLYSLVYQGRYAKFLHICRLYQGSYQICRGFRCQSSLG